MVLLLVLDDDEVGEPVVLLEELLVLSVGVVFWVVLMVSVLVVVLVLVLYFFPWPVRVMKLVTTIVLGGMMVTIVVPLTAVVVVKLGFNELGSEASVSRVPERS